MSAYGWKTYTAGGLLIATGLIAAIAGYIDWEKAIELIGVGGAAIGIGHKLDKLTAKK